jgi:hypothetical protein
MIPEIYLEHLQKYLTKAQLWTLILLINTIQISKQVTLEKLATSLPLPIKQNSRRRHLQRFLTNKCLSVSLLWFPIIRGLIKSLIPPTQDLIIALDRTQWSEHNILMVSVVYQRRSFPIYWLQLREKGCSNLRTQQAVLRPVFRLFKNYHMIVIADREFNSIELAYWLSSQKISFVLRQKKSTYYASKYQQLKPLKAIPIKPGQTLFFPQIRLTQKISKKRFNLLVYWRRKYLKNHREEPWYLLTNLTEEKMIKKLYGQRWGIECLFRDLKSGGYHLESTHVSPDKLSNLILLISLSLISVWLKGKKITHLAISDYVQRPKERRRIRKRASLFSLGLNQETWVCLSHHYRVFVEQKIKYTPNKQALYRQGKEALTLIQQPL